MATPTQHGWASEALFSKALLYVEQMERHTPGDWQFGLWATLSLEMLVRAAVAHISPTLLADGRDWHNVYHALGNQPTTKRFVPRSIAAKDVLLILHELLPDFTKERLESCSELLGHRNAELHSGEDVFAGLGTSSWLAGYYASCEVLLFSMGKSLDDLFSDPQLAKEMIASWRDEAGKIVKKDIDDHKKSWEKKTPEEQETLRAQAIAWATRQAGHRTTCPACESPALIRGSGQGAVTTETRQDLIVQRQLMLPNAFECIACGLKISGLSKLSACDLGDAFTSVTTFSPAEFFNLYTEEDLEEARMIPGEPEWEPDFNEY